MAFKVLFLRSFPILNYILKKFDDKGLPTMEMTLNAELLLMLVINVGAGCIYIGGLFTAIKFIEKQLADLQKHIEKLNDTFERIFHLEERVKSAFNRIDELKEAIKELRKQAIEARVK